MKNSFEKSLRKEAERIGYSKSSNVRNAALSINNAADSIIFYQDISTEDISMTDDNPNRILSSEKYYKKGSNIVAVKPTARAFSVKKFLKKENGIFTKKLLSKKAHKELRNIMYELCTLKGQVYKEKDLKPFKADKNRIKIRGAFCWLSDKPIKSCLSSETIFYDTNGREHKRNISKDIVEPKNNWKERNKKIK